jgi:hypothetical protein
VTRGSCAEITRLPGRRKPHFEGTVGLFDDKDSSNILARFSAESFPSALDRRWARGVGDEDIEGPSLSKSNKRNSAGHRLQMTNDRQSLSSGVGGRGSCRKKSAPTGA